MKTLFTLLKSVVQFVFLVLAVLFLLMAGVIWFLLWRAKNRPVHQKSDRWKWAGFR